MRNLQLLLTLAIGLTLVSCGNSDQSKLDTGVVKNTRSGTYEKKPYNSAKISFDKTEHNFGRIISGEIVRYSFKFTNKGKEDLLISKVSTSCGCTVSSYPRNPIKPGGKGVIEVVFDSRGRKGFQSKTITVLSNSVPNKTILKIKANAIQPEKN